MTSLQAAEALTPFSPATYNQLLDVDDAGHRLDARNDRETFFADAGTLICQHGLDETLGLCLLHQHHQIGDDDVMVETFEPEAYGKPSLVMAKTPRTETPTMVPVVLKADESAGGKFMPLEHSTVTPAIEAYERLALNGGRFLSAFYALATERGFADLIGVSLLRTSALPREEGEELREVIVESTVANVVQACRPSQDEDAESIPTLWKFQLGVDETTGAAVQECEKVWTCVVPKGEHHQKGEKKHVKDIKED